MFKAGRIKALRLNIFEIFLVRCYQRNSICCIGILHEVLHTVENQRVRNTVCLGILRHIVQEESQIDHMDFNVVLRRELGKGIAVGILDQKQFPTLTAALDGSNKNLDLAIKTKSRFFSLTMNNEEDDTPK